MRVVTALVCSHAWTLVRQWNWNKCVKLLSFVWYSGVGGFGGSWGGPGEFRHQQLSTPPSPPTPCIEKISSDFYVLHGPHWAAQWGVRTPGPPGQLRRWTGISSLTLVNTHLSRSRLDSSFNIHSLQCISTRLHSHVANAPINSVYIT